MMCRICKCAIFAFCAAMTALTVAPPTADAADNDIMLSRYATFQSTQSQKNNCKNPCGSVDANRKLFENLVGDFSQVIAPPFLAPAETLGEAGFAVGLVPSVAFIPSDKQHWQDGVEDRSPPSAVFVPNLIVRKGLPFSFEIAGTMSHVSGSDMFTVGSHVKWALNEGFYLFPDVAVRGTVNTLVGSRDLQMLTAGWDVSVSKAFPIAGVMSITPYAGYQQLHGWGWSRLLNVRPQDPRAPQKDSQESGNQPSVDNGFNPEFVFAPHHETSNRFFLGGRLNIWRTSIVLEGIIGESVQQMSASLGLDF
ncbi:MAG: hypothetical protein ABEN55_10505 [Bradymonadaceae bacterium]